MNARKAAMQERAEFKRQQREYERAKRSNDEIVAMERRAQKIARENAATNARKFKQQRREQYKDCLAKREIGGFTTISLMESGDRPAAFPQPL